MRWSARALLLGAAAAVAALGCRSNDCGLVERELHARENDLLAAREELDHCHALNDDLQLQLQALHGDPSACPPGGCDRPGLAYPIHSLTLGRQTGGRDDDDSGGDEALQVVVEPRDADNQVVKVPGALFIQALEITPSGLKQPLSTWQISDDELRRSWQAGLLSTGYMLVLPWKTWPTTDKLRVVVQFHVADGRLFEAEKDVTIRVVPAAKRPAPAAATPTAPPMPPPADTPTLPPPRVLPPPDTVPPAPADQGPDLSPVPADPARKAAWHPDANPESPPAAEILRPVVYPDRK